MSICSSAPRSLLLAGAFFGALTYGRRRAAAGQSARCGTGRRAALPPGSPMIGRPDNEAAAKLAPVAAVRRSPPRPTSCRWPS